MATALVVDLVLSARECAALQIGELVDQALVVEQTGTAGSEQRQHVEIDATAIELGFKAGNVNLTVGVGDPAFAVVVAGDLGAAVGAQQQQGHIRQIAGQRLVICLSDAVYAALERKAVDMQKSAVELSGELLEAIISSDIYEAVLDDDKLT